MNLPEDLKHGARGQRPTSIAAGIVVGALTGALITADIAGCAMDRVVDEQRNVETVKRVNAYACGYLHGQRAVIQNARLRIQEPEFMENCPVYTDEAISHGFIVARKNR